MTVTAAYLDTDGRLEVEGKYRCSYRTSETVWADGAQVLQDDLNGTFGFRNMATCDKKWHEWSNSDLSDLTRRLHHGPAKIWLGIGTSEQILFSELRDVTLTSRQ